MTLWLNEEASASPRAQVPPAPLPPQYFYIGDDDTDGEADGEAAALRLVVISVILAFGALGASEILARRVRARIAGAS